MEETYPSWRPKLAQSCETPDPLGTVRSHSKVSQLMDDTLDETSYGVPPNLLMTASQEGSGLNLFAFMLLPLLPDHLHQASWSYLTFVAMSGVQSSSKLLFILWNFNEDAERGFEVAIWRLGVLEALRRSMAYLALLATYAGNLWIYKQV
eukprot:s915_g10.t1